ncbi:endonuclease [Novosphingobium marinum]|uniref:Endonuclease/exonuclease/phosphatase family metal-dependent hydrolase n=1 Tax=Novosphingobium marinum TaxID=1514948 RepID=A0A7Y9XUA9_9SPHN|nr:endonuclease/exonuclease/phosphatase family protein [Novosphingobium marinum]NYH94675.1 endonuclease/exonuclease/phosphatase family metal-dependent hydrolase [Novosphingobium marinum]GGC38259.1 endonuclease [Novosphingobium marinum]
MQLTVASYNIHKAVGLDRRRDPDRILTVLREIDADVVALQEADRRFGKRETVLPLAAIYDHSPYKPVPLSMRPDSIGWHGNALLVRRNIDILSAHRVPLPTLEPRGAIRADLASGERRFRVIGMHLDLSGLRRRHQVRSVLDHIGGCEPECPTVLMGDLNEWARRGGCLREFGQGWRILAPGASFPSRRPVAHLDRIILSPEWRTVETKAHHSALSAQGSDHLPILARLMLPNI